MLVEYCSVIVVAISYANFPKSDLNSLDLPNDEI